jgi:hypothetical protein
VAGLGGRAAIRLQSAPAVLAVRRGGTAVSTIAASPPTSCAWAWRTVADVAAGWRRVSRGGTGTEVPTVQSWRCCRAWSRASQADARAITLARRRRSGRRRGVRRARLLAQGGRRDESAALLTEALERYEQAGADAWAGRVRGRLRPLGVRPGSRGSRHRPAGGWESLTTTEQAVSRLVAEGLTNGAVATIVSERSCSRNVSTLGGSPARHTGDLRSAGPPTGSRFNTIRDRPAMAFNRIGASGAVGRLARRDHPHRTARPQESHLSPCPSWRAQNRQPRWHHTTAHVCSGAIYRRA